MNFWWQKTAYDESNTNPTLGIPTTSEKPWSRLESGCYQRQSLLGNELFGTHHENIVNMLLASVITKE
jgi:hypothetical protein